MTLKILNNSDPGDADHVGGNDWDESARAVNEMVANNLTYQKPALYVPLFIYPSPLTAWQRVADLKTLVPQLEIIATMNPNNGDFSSRDADFANGITILDDAGVKVIGYVYTGYGTRASGTVQGCIDNYVTYYPEVRGIFFDEMDNVTGHETYYSNLNTYTHTTNGLPITVGNPGTTTIASYVGTLDTLLIYEIAGLPSPATLSAATFGGIYNRRNFGAIPYNVASITTYGIRALLRYTGLFYTTSDTTPNPWDTLPSYLEDLAVTIANYV